MTNTVKTTRNAKVSAIPFLSIACQLRVQIEWNFKNSTAVLSLDKFASSFLVMQFLSLILLRLSLV